MDEMWLWEHCMGITSWAALWDLQRHSQCLQIYLTFILPIFYIWTFSTTLAFSFLLLVLQFFCLFSLCVAHCIHIACKFIWHLWQSWFCKWIFCQQTKQKTLRETHSHELQRYNFQNIKSGGDQMRAKLSWGCLGLVLVSSILAL